MAPRDRDQVWLVAFIQSKDGEHKMKSHELEKLDLPPEVETKSVVYPAPVDWIAIGKSIEDSREKSLDEYEDDIVEAGIILVDTYRASLSGASVPFTPLVEAVDAYHAALRKAKRERR